MLKRPLVVEIVGVAGAGKSTLVRALGARDRSIRTRLGVWHVPPHLLIGHAIQGLPALFELYRRHRWFHWHEAQYMIRLDALHYYLGQESSSGHRVMLLDEGAIFVLARLHAFGHDSVKQRLFKDWWQCAFSRCRRTVDLIIWLDAPDDILLRRIRSRAQTHSMKTAPDQALFRFFASWRAAYDSVLSNLSGDSGPTVLTFETEHESTEELVARVEHVLNEQHSAGYPCRQSSILNPTSEMCNSPCQSR